MSFFEKSVMEGFARAIATRAPWADVQVVPVPVDGVTVQFILAEPAPGYGILIHGAGRKLVARMVSTSADEGFRGIRTGIDGGSIPLSSDPDFVGESVAEVLRKWRDAAAAGVLDDAASSSRFFASVQLPKVRSGPNISVWAGWLVILVVAMFFSGQARYQIVASLVLSVGALCLGGYGVLTSDRYGGKGMMSGPICVLAALVFLGWAIYALFQFA